MLRRAWIPRHKDQLRQRMAARQVFPAGRRPTIGKSCATTCRICAADEAGRPSISAHFSAGKVGPAIAMRFRGRPVQGDPARRAQGAVHAAPWAEMNASQARFSCGRAP
jgi:hypothetical protein